MYPTITEYNKVIQKEGSSAFNQLYSEDLQFIPAKATPFKVFTYGSGTFAVIFKAKEDNKKFALRCFIGGNQNYIKRYKTISHYLNNIDATWKTGFDLYENEISVNNKLFPVVKMEWVEGMLINEYITQNVNNNQVLNSLQKKIVELSKSLEEHKIGHGDIQCGNVLIDQEEDIRLIDYDGMYVPAFKGQEQAENGMPEFQHPKRKEDILFNEKIDRFSFWVILCALETLKYDKSLWNKVSDGGFNTEENFLFEGKDFKDWEASKLIQKLRQINEPSLNFYLNKLQRFCKASPNAIDTPQLYNKEGLIPTQPESSEGNDNVPLNNEIKISSNIKAVVLNQALQKIGETPLNINRSEYLDKELIVSCGEQKRKIRINNETHDFNFKFKRNYSAGHPPKKKEKQKKKAPKRKVPLIKRFSINPQVVRKRDSINIEWEVENAEEIKIYCEDLSLVSLDTKAINTKGEKEINLRNLKKAKKGEWYKIVIVARGANNKEAKESASFIIRRNYNWLMVPALIILFIIPALYIHSKIYNNTSIRRTNQIERTDKGTNASKPTVKNRSQNKHFYTHHELKNIIKRYYQSESNRNLEKFKSHFKFPINTYFSKKDVSFQQFKSMVEHSWKIIQYSKNRPDFNEIKIYYSRKAYDIYYPLTYSYSLKGENTVHIKKYNIHLRLNSEGKITYINNNLTSQEIGMY